MYHKDAIITITKEQFLLLAKAGMEVARVTDMENYPNTYNIYYYNPLAIVPDSDSSRQSAISGYVFRLKRCDSSSDFIMGLWDYFDGVEKFQVIKPPHLKILRSRKCSQ